LSTVWLIVDVFERDIARMSDDMTAFVRFDHLNGQVFEGQIDYIYPALDAATRTLPVRLRVDNSEGLLKPNMFGNVSLVPNETRQALTVPTEAIIRTGGAERVILKTGEGTFAPRLVTTGLRDNFGGGGRTEVVQGLAPGEEVVASAQFLIDSESALSAGLMRMAPTDQEPARGAGELLAFDPQTRMATIRHGDLESVGWPSMDTTFAVRADIAVARLMAGQQIKFEVIRGAEQAMRQWLETEVPGFNERYPFAAMAPFREALVKEQPAIAHDLSRLKGDFQVDVRARGNSADLAIQLPASDQHGVSHFLGRQPPRSKARVKRTRRILFC
jgi:Cu(I)/Ag(I) efflux system membrane fusion protein